MAYSDTYTAQNPEVALTDLLAPARENASTTLYQDITAGTPADGANLRVVDKSAFSTNGGVVRVNSAEIMLYAGTGNDATSDYLSSVTRAVTGGGAAAAASAGDTVEEVMSREHLIRVLREIVDMQKRCAVKADTELTIATGAITVTQSYHSVDTEGDAASDDLDTISGGAEGLIVVLQAAHTDRTVVVKDGTGNIQLPRGDINLDDTVKLVALIHDGTNWRLLGGDQELPPAHGAGQHTDITRRLWIGPVAGTGAAVSAHGNYPTVLLDAATDEALFAFQVPADYVSNGTIKAYVIPTTTGTFDWTINVNFAADGEDEALGSDTTTADGTAATDDQMTGINVSAAFDGIAAADVVGARFVLDVLTTTTEIHVVGLSFEYTANQ